MSRPFGTLVHKSFRYFMLRVGTMLVGLALSVVLRLVLPDPTVGGGFWSDFLQGGLLGIATLPIWIAAIWGDRLLRRWWTVVPG